MLIKLMHAGRRNIHPSAGLKLASLQGTFKYSPLIHFMLYYVVCIHVHYIIRYLAFVNSYFTRVGEIDGGTHHISQ